MSITMPNNFIFELHPDVFKVFKDYQQVSGRKEAGGILLGTVFPEKVLIEIATSPNNRDKAGRFFFNRNVDMAQLAVNRAWAESGGKTIYVGEWHTHPEPKPTPSSDDHKLLWDMLLDTKMHIDFLFMIIIGTQECLVMMNHKQNANLKIPPSSKYFSLPPNNTSDTEKCGETVGSGIQAIMRTILKKLPLSIGILF
jgi:integrative and conjugative element protein (TIGR02256 family)